MIIRKIVLLFATTFLTFGCSESNTADERLRMLFKISPSVTLDEKNISDAVLKIIPIGTPDTEIGKKLQTVGVGSATISTYYSASDRRYGIIKIDFDPTTFGLVKNSYTIHLVFDDNKKLSNVSTETVLTGL